VPRNLKRAPQTGIPEQQAEQTLIQRRSETSSLPLMVEVATQGKGVVAHATDDRFLALDHLLRGVMPTAY
jgi:hypothetical protein